MEATVRDVFRCVVKHVRAVNDASLAPVVPQLKRQMRRRWTPGQLRHRLADLYEIEAALRNRRLGRGGSARVLALLDPRAVEAQVREKNQGGKHALRQQHEMRRFDEYNAPPPRGSAAAAAVHRRAAFSNQFWNFVHASRLPPQDGPLKDGLLKDGPPADRPPLSVPLTGVRPDISSSSRWKAPDAETRRRSVLVATILAPYAHEQQQRERRDRTPHGPRPVKVKSVTRNGGTVPVLQVRGQPAPAHGLVRHLELAERDEFAQITRLTEQVWLAKQYARDELDGENMAEWIEQLQGEIATLKRTLYERKQKFEVSRRILLRRRAEIERDWEWRHRVAQQNRQRRLKLQPPKLLELRSL